MMTPAEFDDRLIDFEDAVIERERTPEFGRSLLAAKLALQEGIEAEYKKVYELARELAEALNSCRLYGYAPSVAEDHARAAGLLEVGE